MKKNFLFVHGVSGTVPWLTRLAEDIKSGGNEVMMPNLPIKKEATVEAWQGVLDGLKDRIGLNTVVVAHSLGCLAVVRFLVRVGIKINRIVFVAGFADLRVAGGLAKDTVDYLAGVIPPFILTEQEKSEFKKLCKKRHCVYSDDDHLLALDNLKKFADDLNSEHVFIPNMGHFGSVSGVKDIPQVCALVCDCC